MKKNRFFTFSLYFVLFGIIIYNIYLSSLIVLSGDIGFNTDLARDFLLLQEMQTESKIPLIGPRSGGISGVFHGPLWIYTNFPAFFLGNGNPLVVGWFWVILNILLIFVCYYVGWKVYGKWVGILSALLISSLSVVWTHALFNPYGAVLLSPLFLYFLTLYFKKAKNKYLLISLFILGLILQFQIAFAAPLIFLVFLIVIAFAIKKKVFKHLFSFAILLIPLSTYIVFDLRHEFLQAKAVLNHLSGKSGSIENFGLTELLNNRFEGFVSGLVTIPYPHTAIFILILALFGFLLVKFIFIDKKERDVFLGLFLYFYAGYWLVTFAFSGVIWNYYYWPFIPLSAIIISSCFRKMSKFLFIPIFAIILISSMNFSYGFVNHYINTQLGKDSGSWLFNFKIAQIAYSQKDKEFGYFVFSPDEFGYSPRYAMDYVSRLNPSVKSLPFEKKSVTYLLISPPGGKNDSISGTWWKANRVNIDGEPIKNWTFENGFVIEKHELTQEEISIPSDPNLINSLFFR